MLDRVSALGLKDNVKVIGRYLPFDELITYLRATDVYVTPYLNPDQVVSGALAYALGAGKAIVSTPYLYARELLSNARGLLAEFRDSRSLARAIGRFLDEPELRARTQERAYALGRHMIWSNVAAKYAALLAATSLKWAAHTMKKPELTSLASGATAAGSLAESAPPPQGPMSAESRLHTLRAGSLHLGAPEQC